MPSTDWLAYAHKYFKRFTSAELLLSAPVHEQCQMIVVIPCHNEPDLIGTLNSLTDCSPPEAPFEVIVVVNQSIAAPDLIKAQNKKSIADFNDWHVKFKTAHPESKLSFHLIEALDMPRKHAGVGLARKTGMDEALRRFASAEVDGSIICLDADCRVSRNYLRAIEDEFVNTSFTLGEMHFEHQWQDEKDNNLKSGIVNYELFLRYYVEGLRQAGFPNAIHTIGSCMLTKASAYARHGGMNKRKAGEDFYFLHKLVPHEAFTTVTGGTVYPSCRTSDRVPFGTGKAQQDWLDSTDDAYYTYDPTIFPLLKSLLEKAPLFYTQTIDSVTKGLSKEVKEFLEAHAFPEKIALIKANCRSARQFEKQFFIWFDGFLCMKFVHYMRDHFYPDVPIREAASSLIKTESNQPEKLLEMYRINDLQAAASVSSPL